MKEVDFDIIIPEKEDMVAPQDEDTLAQSDDSSVATSDEKKTEDVEKKELTNVPQDEDDKPQKEEKSTANWRQWLMEDDERLDREMLREFIKSIEFTTFFRNNWKIILVIVVYSIIYVSMGYYHRNLLIENDKYTREVLDRRYKALTRSSELHERTLGSKIEDQLQDTTLQSSTEAPYELPVSAKED